MDRKLSAKKYYEKKKLDPAFMEDRRLRAAKYREDPEWRTYYHDKVEEWMKINGKQYWKKQNKKRAEKNKVK